MRITRKAHFDGTPMTNREILTLAALRVETFVDNNPLTATFIACGSVHIAGYTVLHYATRPPRKTTTITTVTEKTS